MKHFYYSTLLFVLFCTQLNAQTKIFEHVLESSSFTTSVDKTEEGHFLVGSSFVEGFGINIVSGQGEVLHEFTNTDFSHTSPLLITPIGSDELLIVLSNSYLLHYNINTQELISSEQLTHPMGEKHFLRYAFKHNNQLFLFGYSSITPNGTGPTTTWHRRYTLDLNDLTHTADELIFPNKRITKIKAINDTEVLVLSKIYGNDYTSELAIYNINTFEALNTIELSGFYQDIDFDHIDEIYLSGFNENERAVLSKLNNFTEQQILYTAGGYNFSQASQVLLKDEHIYITVRYNSNFYGEGDLYVYKLDQSANTLWFHRIGTSYELDSSNIAADLIDNTGSELILFGSTDITDVVSLAKSFWYGIDIITGLEELANTKQLLLYPNPTPANIQLNLNENTASLVNIYNAMGKLVYSKNFNNTSLANIDLSALPRGTFFVELIENKKRRLQKLLIQR